MEFTYAAYRDLLSLLREENYRFCDYFDYKEVDKCVILRHDVDYSVEHAVKMAQIEHGEGVRSTYFVLLRTDFYNPASRHVTDALRRIRALGHEVGLHFDEVAYRDCGEEALPEMILREAKLLGDICGFPIRCFSMHRPNQLTIEKNLEVTGIVNAYGQEFFRGFKYLSDSRRHWREPVLDIIRSGEQARLHILTHAFWYGEQERSIGETIGTFVRGANRERYDQMAENIRAIEEILHRNEV